MSVIGPLERQAETTWMVEIGLGIVRGKKYLLKHSTLQIRDVVPDPLLQQQREILALAYGYYVLQSQ